MMSFEEFVEKILLYFGLTEAAAEEDIRVKNDRKNQRYIAKCHGYWVAMRYSSQGIVTIKRGNHTFIAEI